MKILWHSVAPWAPTGYGTQTGTVTPRLKALGHDVAISAYYGLQGAMLDWRGLKVYPSYSASYGKDVLVSHALHHFGAHDSRSLREVSARGIVITLTDVWVLDAPLLDQLAVAAWTPIDHDPVPPGVVAWFEATGAVPLAMSRFGQAQLEAHGLASLYVPHGVDTAIFSPGLQLEARARCGLPADAFVVGMVAANVGRDGARKAFGEQLEAFAELRRRHSDAVMVLHTDIDSPVGVKLRSLIEQFPEGSILYTDQYALRKGMAPERVADVYRAMDLLTNASWGEGFGLPIVEAQACGTPVVVTDATSMPELVGAGWKVPYDRLWHDSQASWAARPRVADLIDAYEDAYQARQNAGDWTALRNQAISFAQFYDADLVTDTYWRPTLERLEQALAERAERVATIPKATDLAERLVQADGFIWIDRGPNSDDGIGYGIHEATLQPILERLLPDGGTFLDIGAHVGRWTLRLSRKAGRVIAVEANPATAKTLRRHLAINAVEHVEVLNVAAWDEPTWLTLDDPNRQLEGGSTRVMPGSWEGRQPPRLARNGEPIVQATRLDDQLDIGAPHHDALGGRLDLVKLDVEGADLQALRGMARLLARYRPALFVELHHIYGYYALDDLLALLSELGYVPLEGRQRYLAAEYLTALPKEDAHAPVTVTAPDTQEAQGDPGRGAGRP